MRTRHDRALAIYRNAIDLGVGFRHEGDAVIALSPTTDGAGREHPALQSVLDRYQPELCALVPAWGVAPDRLRPATTESVTYQPDKMDVVRRGVENATKAAAKPKRYGHRQPRAKPKVAAPKPGMTRAGGWVAWAVPDACEP